MKSFSIEKVLRTSSYSNCESRLGTIHLCLCPSKKGDVKGNDTGSNSLSPISSHRTPMYLIHTQGGSVPHVTPEVFQLIYPTVSSNHVPPLQISIDSTMRSLESLEKFEKGIGRYVGFPDLPTFLTIHDSLQPLKSGHNDKFGVALWSRHGRTSLTPEIFVKAIENCKPSLCQILSDYDVRPESSGLKRLKKSLSRAEEYTNFIVKEEKEKSSGESAQSTGLFITVEAAWFEMNEKLAKNAVLNLLESQHQIEGIVIAGLTNRFANSVPKNDESKRAGSEPKKLNVCESLNVDLLDKIIKLLPPALPKYAPGSFSLPQMVDLISKGIDILDSSVTSKMADNAEVFLLDNVETVLHSLTMSVKGKQARDNEELAERSGETNHFTHATCALKNSVISLKDKRFFEDFRSLSNCCTCYTCRKHTRSYVHHLYATEELLGPVLIQIHNMTVIDRFFEIIRGLLQDSADRVEIVEEKLVTIKKLLSNSSSVETSNVAHNDKGEAETECASNV